MPIKKEEPNINDNTIVFSVSDPTGTIVNLYPEQWDHIKKGHPEIKPMEKVRSGVQRPDLILEDEERNARIYTTILPTNSYFNVFAGKVSETECKIRTSYIKKDMPSGDCIWQRQKK